MLNPLNIKHKTTGLLTMPSNGFRNIGTFAAKIRSKGANITTPFKATLEGQNKLGQVALFLKESFLFKVFWFVAPQYIFQVPILSWSV